MFFDKKKIGKKRQKFDKKNTIHHITITTRNYKYQNPGGSYTA